MTFLTDVEPKRFDDFVKNHPTKSHFMQSAAWGELAEKEKGDKAYRVGLANSEGRLVAAALLLLRKPPMMPGYLYSPRGYVLDFKNQKLVYAFTKYIVRFAENIGAMFVKIDPDVERREIDKNGEPVPGGFNNSNIIEHLMQIGYRHRGFNLGFEGRQPRFTFRIDLSPDEQQIEKNIRGNVMKNVRKGEKYAAEISLGKSADIAELHRLICLTGERDNFYGYPKSYYQAFYDILAKHDMARLYLGKVYPKEILDMLRQKLAETQTGLQKLKKPGAIDEAHATIARLRREIDAFERYATKYPNGELISAHLVVAYGKHAWAVHAGSSSEMNESFINNRVYVYKLLDAKKRGALWLDQFGTIGNPNDGALKSLHEFKRQFGGRYIEFIGEFDYVIKPFWYWLYETAIPKYRALRFKLKDLQRGKTKR